MGPSCARPSARSGKLARATALVTAAAGSMTPLWLAEQGGVGGEGGDSRAPRASGRTSRGTVSRELASLALAHCSGGQRRVRRVKGNLGSVKASAASSPRHHERDLSEDRGDRSRGKRRSRRFPSGPSITSAALPLLWCSFRGVRAWFPPPCHQLPSLPQSKPALPQPLPMQPPFLSSWGLGLSACISRLPLCSASHIRHPALGQYSLRLSAHVSRLFLVFLLFSEPHDFCLRLCDLITYFEVLSRYALPTCH